MPGVPSAAPAPARACAPSFSPAAPSPSVIWAGGGDAYQPAHLPLACFLAYQAYTPCNPFPSPKGISHLQGASWAPLALLVQPLRCADLDGSKQQQGQPQVHPPGLTPADTELYWFVVFWAPAEQPPSPSPAAWRDEALSVVHGWAWGLPEAVQATPLEDLSRSRLVDR